MVVFMTEKWTEARWFFDAVRAQYETFARDIAPVNLEEPLPGRPVISICQPYAEAPFPAAQVQGEHLLGLTACTTGGATSSGGNGWRSWSNSASGASTTPRAGTGSSRPGMSAGHAAGRTTPLRGPDDGRYISREYEPHRRENALVVFGLINAFELTGARACLDACVNWAERQTERRYGPFTDAWRGARYAWQSYTPLDEKTVPDAVCNVIGRVGSALAQIGYLTAKDVWIRQAEQFMIYLCKEKRRDGSWGYMGSAYLADPRLGDDTHDCRHHAHNQWLQLWNMAEAVEYLALPGRRPPQWVGEAILRGVDYMRNAGYTTYAATEKPGSELNRMFTLPKHLELRTCSPARSEADNAKDCK